MLVSFGKKLIGHKWGLFNQIWAEIQTSFCIRIHTKDVSEIYRVHKHYVCVKFVWLSILEEKLIGDVSWVYFSKRASKT